MKFRYAFVVACIALSGCVTTSTRSVPEASAPVAPDDRYESVAGRDAATIDPLRAAPAQAAEILPGKNPSIDQEQLTPQSYVLIGNSYHRRNDEAARGWIAAQGRDVGADKIRWYASTDGGETALSAAYYVRLRLVFGASFRDLNAQEQAQFGNGVRLGEIVGDSPASRANLRASDVVSALDGVAVRDRAGFQRLLRDNMGKVVNLSLSRNGEPLQRKVKLGRSFAATP
ncbi:PDZ domain-containing protein [Tahibacter aquaticus]|uniref:PDZ domain-containing protein n=1 Tax=Tahibacter aquaticus TaxID=520092 RepID=A0A4R6YQR4_9GAMM|nr:PDZ domain-containing protein [Tahibacter aquaticus]TDR40072.1 PDZ domain-containing protein [Tahibacter aquaticus]